MQSNKSLVKFSQISFGQTREQRSGSANKLFLNVQKTELIIVGKITEK